MRKVSYSDDIFAEMFRHRPLLRWHIRVIVKKSRFRKCYARNDEIITRLSSIFDARRAINPSGGFHPLAR